MSNKIKVVLNRGAVKTLLKSPEMQAVCAEHAKTIQTRCGDGYETKVHVGKNRCNASVYADTYQAKRDNSKNNTLLKAVR